MLALFTDYGYQGPYIGQLHTMIYKFSPNAKIIDLMHDVPRFRIKHSAYLLARLTGHFPHNCIFCCVVDPGVGSARKPCVINADGQWLVGPQNGLFDRVIDQAEKTQYFELTWQPEQLSTSFHGRDLFAPVAAMLDKGETPAMQETAYTPLYIEHNLFEVIYMDGFGNAVTGIQAESLPETAVIKINGHHFNYAKNFSSVSQNEGFWYKNSMGLIEIAACCNSAKNLFVINIGQDVIVTG